MSTWERLAARPGGTVAGLATATTSDGASLVFAATSAGVYRSSDGGRSWVATSAGTSIPFGEVVAVSPSFAHDRTLFVGGRHGLYRSTDGGTRWVRVLADARIASLALAPAVLFAGTQQDGILRSEDGGRSWDGANAGLLDLTVLAVALSPGFGQDGTGFAATAYGLYRTRNGGKSWRAVELDRDDLALQCLALSPGFAEDRLALAGTESDGLLRSDDAGGHWAPVAGLEERSVTAIAFSTQRTVAAATDLGIALSKDGGRTWQITTTTHLAPVLALTCVPQPGGEVLLAGLHRDGVARSLDGGERWTPANQGLQARLLLGLALSPAFEADQTLFAAGPDDGVLVSTDNGRTWTAHLVGPDAPPVFGVAPSPTYARDRTLYAATALGIYRSRDAGTSWQLAPSGAQPDAAAMVVTGPPLLAAMSGGRLLQSDDEGQSWRPLSDHSFAGEIVSLALSPAYTRDRTLFVGTTNAGDVTLWRSTDGGQRWQRWLVERGEELLPLAMLSSYPIDEVILVGLGGRVLKPLRHASELRSAERRPIWRGAEVGEAGALVTALAASDPATVFAATSAGVYVSHDGGSRFTAWSDGLAPTSVVALGVSPSFARDRLVYALGLGGTIWRRTHDQ